MFARLAILAAAAGLLTAAAPAGFTLPAGTPPARFLTACDGKEGWTDPAPPVRVFGNTYYVGTCGIAALLIASDQGHVLIDSGPKEAAPLVAANIRALGLKLEDVKWIVSSHPHHDHVGGIAELKQLTGAKLAGSAAARVALEQGKNDWRDPQASSTDTWPKVTVDRVMRDGEHLVLGPLDIALHTTPGHAPGSTSWTWRSCAGSVCHDMAYIDSVTSVSTGDYKYSQHAVYADAFARSLGKIAALPCDLLTTPHPGASAFFERLAGKRPLAEPDACLNYAVAGQAGLEQRLKDEGAGK
jgi:metallo-beta-lactamase class B